MSEQRRRVLVGILVYNGQAVVPACLESAAGLSQDFHDVDVLVLDDCSPAPGWSDEVAELCAKLGLGYYRSPRNLGIPRNMSMAFLAAMDGDYDHVAIVNSDTILPTQLFDHMVAIFDIDARVGSVTPWSNNVSVFSLPMQGAMPALRDQASVDVIAGALSREFGAHVLDIPTGVGYCLVMPTRVVRHVGLMDPLFGRGYCEEVDWCQRARLAGYRNVLGLGTFVFHHGGATNRAEGLLQRGHTTVMAHEAVIDHRYPDYRGRVHQFAQEDPLDDDRRRAMRAIAIDAARRHRFELVVSSLTMGEPTASDVQLVVAPTGPQDARIDHMGLSVPVRLASADPILGLIRLVGVPTSVTIRDRGPLADDVWRWATGRGIPVEDRARYPGRV